MHLKYYHVTFESKRKLLPADMFEAILYSLKIVFAVYGHNQYGHVDGPHTLHCLIEDDIGLRTFYRLPTYLRARAHIVREIKNIIPFVNHMKLIMLDEPDLRILDNSEEYRD